MQFIVFAAFAIVLSVPPDGPPWSRLTSPTATWLIVIGHVLATAAVAAVYAYLVRVKLEREPVWLPGAQQRLAQGNTAVRALVLGGTSVSVYLTDWSVIVRSWPAVNVLWGLDELVMLLPCFVATLLAWTILYPADRAVRQVALELRLWASVPARPVWRLASYLGFMLRHHILIVAVPMTLIVVANDFVNLYGQRMRMATGLVWADQVLLVCIAGLVFLVAPVLLRYIWHTRPLPPGDLRTRLEALCARIGLTYHRILIWESDGMVVNAAVMGIIRPVRYILLSDGLLEMMDDRKIEAVFGHEAGHVKHRHMHFFLLFAVLSMLLVGGMVELVYQFWPEALGSRAIMRDYAQVGAMVMIVLVWMFGFGAVSRRFEWQADLYGTRCVTASPEDCQLPCFYHGTAAVTGPEIPPPPPQAAVCATAVNVFADGLHRIAVLNGIPPEARSWRHSSIANRIRRLKSYALDPFQCRRLEREVAVIKAILLLGTLIGLGIGLWLYWPQPRHRSPRSLPPTPVVQPAPAAQPASVAQPLPTPLAASHEPRATPPAGWPRSGRPPWRPARTSVRVPLLDEPCGART